MNLRTLSSPAMLSNSDPWLNNAAIRAPLESHQIGVGALAELQVAHDQLANHLSRRQQIELRIDLLTATITKLDNQHDSGARGLHGFLGAFAEIASDPVAAAAFINARELLFPDDLAIVNRPYIEEHGTSLAIDGRITQEVRDLLAQTQVGTATLDDIYNQWIASGVALGEHVHKRNRLQSSIGSLDASAGIDVRRARTNWIQAAQIFLTIVDRLPLSDEVRRMILAPLRIAIADAQRRRALAQEGEATGDEGDGDVLDSPAEDEPTDDEPADDEPAEDEPTDDELPNDELADDEPVEDEPVEDPSVR